MIRKETLLLLRFPFSLFLLPVFLFAWSQAPETETWKSLGIFVILHLLVYPSSNGYNSYHDRDSGAIGGLKSPPKPSRELFWVCNAMDLTAVAAGFLFSPLFALQVFVYILASRLYSNRRIRIKKYPVAGFIWVIFFQGGFTYWLVQTGLSGPGSAQSAFLFQPEAKLCATLLLGAMYPLSQIYQHESDKRDGVITISMLCGYRGTFLLSALCFALANIAAWIHFQHWFSVRSFWVMQLFFIPVTSYFVYWFVRVMKDRHNADYDHAMRMNLLASLCLNLCFTAYLLCL